MLKFALVFGLVVATTNEVLAQDLMIVQCQKNITDGRVLISANDLPTVTSRFKILAFAEIKRDAKLGWAFGDCKIRITNGSGTQSLQQRRG